jgi:nucleoporin SEH1
VGCDKKVQIWRQAEGRKWRLWEGSDQFAVEAAVNAVAWAPNLGRSYELLATASQDRTVRVWKMSGEVVEQVACFRDHKAEVFHVEFNVTGTVMASSGDDGVVRLWTRDLNTPNGWIALSQVANED